MKKRNFLSLVLAALMLLSCLACSQAAPAASSAPEAATKKIQFTVVVDDKSEVFDLVTTEETLGAALLANGLIEGTEGDYGLFVTTVNGRKADDAKQEWWCFTKGGEMMMTGVDSTEIADGDAYECTLTVGW
jgi:hypothetical protein